MKKTNMNNKGFSLVELIIVIAILAILVAIIGSQVIPYIEKSRVSKDLTTLSTVQQSFQTVLADFSAKNDSPKTQVVATYGTLDATLSTVVGVAVTGWDKQLNDLTKLDPTSSITHAEALKRFNSKAAKGGTNPTLQLHFYPDTGEIAVSLGDLSVSTIGGSKSDAAFTPVSP